jgi:hypothetical protein|tara:strand:- start:42 stop:611 length:570 start_codon:yes stop_codon:yes gene_type:complete
MGRRKRMHGRRRHCSNSPIRQDGKWLDRAQSGLSAAGLAFPPADALNALISGGRAGYSAYTGDVEGTKKHGGAAVLNLAAIVPGVGEAIAIGKSAKGLNLASKFVKGAKKYAKRTKIGKQLKTAKETLANPNLMKSVGLGGNIGYWGGTGKQVTGEIKDVVQKSKPFTGYNLNTKQNINKGFGFTKNIT